MRSDEDRDLRRISGGASAPRRAAPFRPVFSLTLLWFSAFFLLYSLLLVAPALLRVASGPETGPALQARAQAAAYEAIQGRLPLAFLAALVTTGLGSYTRVLPGLRGPR